MKKVTIKCDNCGNEFGIFACYLKRPRKNRFCCKSCEAEFKNLRNTVHSYRGGHVAANGYRYISINGKQREEHRLIMERVLGRPLATDEQVHHINGDKLDNRPENLLLVSNSDHQKMHAKGKTTEACRRCGERKEMHAWGLCGNCYAWARKHKELDKYRTGAVYEKIRQ